MTTDTRSEEAKEDARTAGRKGSVDLLRSCQANVQPADLEGTDPFDVLLTFDPARHGYTKEDLEQFEVRGRRLAKEDTKLTRKLRRYVDVRIAQTAKVFGLTTATTAMFSLLVSVYQREFFSLLRMRMAIDAVRRDNLFFEGDPIPVFVPEEQNA